VGREKALASVINFCEPDLVVLEEAVRPGVVERLASACGMTEWGGIPGNSLGFLSRAPIEHYGWHRALLARRRYLEVLPSGGGPRVFGVHLSALHSNALEWRRRYELRSLLSQIAEYRQAFHVAMGDFNTLAPTEELDLRRLPPRLRALAWMTGGRIRWRTIALMIDAGYADAYRALHPDEPGYTFPTWDPHIRLDFVFLPATFASRITRCEVMRDAPGAREASDHFPLLAEIG
jgi:exodeoxyribonuclease-3